MKHIPLNGMLLPFMFILLQACASGKINSSYSNKGSVPPLNAEFTGTALPGESVYRNEINIRAVRHFKQMFPEAQDEQWYVIKHGFMAKYRKDDTNIRIDYSKQGNWLYTIRYINEKKLPREVRNLVRSTWFDYSISSAEEIQINHGYIYVIHIHEGNDWKIIRVADGEMDEIIPPGKGGQTLTL